MISDKHFNKRERERVSEGGRERERTLGMEGGEKENGTTLLHISIPKTMIGVFKACYSAD